MSRQFRRHQRTLFLRYMRRQVKERQGEQPWYRRYRKHLLIPLILGYAMIYACRSEPLKLVDPLELQIKIVLRDLADDDSADEHKKP